MSAIRHQIAARRTQARQAPAAATSAFGDGGLEDATVESAIRKARRGGKLDLSSFGLTALPLEVYTDLLGVPAASLSRPPAPADAASPPVASLDRFGAALRIGGGTDDQPDDGRAFGAKAQRAREERERVWVEPEELTSFKAADNAIASLDDEVGMFGGLKGFDMARNRLTALPNSFADLLRLTSLDLSSNALTALPPAILLLPALQTLNLSHNLLAALSFASPVPPSDEGLSYGAGFLSTSFTRAAKAPTVVWPKLLLLNLGHNHLKDDAVDALVDADVAPRLRTLNLESNRLDGTLDMGAFTELVTLNVAYNAGLRGVDAARGVEVKHDGCAWGAATSSSAPNSSDGAAGESATAAAAGPAAKPPRRGPPKPVPSPTHTIVYRTLPAASFHSEPLAIQFDLYLPDAPPTSPAGHPVVVWWHGGGLLQGNKENLPPHFRRLPAHAFPTATGTTEHVAVVSPNYRLAPQAPILDILSDASAALAYVRTKLNGQLATLGSAHTVDPSRICLSGGSAGGYLALMAGLPAVGTNEDVGGYRGDLATGGIQCLAPFYPITDLTHAFWQAKTDPVPWWSGSVPDSAARPHLNPRDPPVDTAVSGGPRAILYPYMLQHALFPSLLFMSQRGVGAGLDAFRPTPESLSVTHRLRALKTGQRGGATGGKRPPVYMLVGTQDDKVQPLDETAALLDETGETVIDVLDVDHGFDEDPDEECESFRSWLGEHLF